MVATAHRTSETIGKIGLGLVGGRGRRPAKPGGGKVPGPLPPSLVKEADSGIYVCAAGCRCVACPACGERVLSDRRVWMRAVSAEWDRHLVTLTIDPKRFKSAESAFEHVRTNRLVSKLMRELGVDLWISVVEFMQNDQVHWHLMIDGRVDAKRMWALWRDEYGCGRVDVERERHSGALATYLSKYLSKAPELPAWALEKERFRFVSCSRKVMGFAEYLGSCPGDGVEDEAQEQAERSHVSIGERVENCGRSSTVFTVAIGDDGKRHKRYWTSLCCSLDEAIEAVEQSGAAREVEVRYKVVAWLKDATGAMVRDENGKCVPQTKLAVGVRGVYLRDLGGLRCFLSNRGSDRPAVWDSPDAPRECLGALGESSSAGRGPAGGFCPGLPLPAVEMA